MSDKLRRTSDFIQDLDIFCKLAEQLEDSSRPSSLRQIAEGWGNELSASALSACIARLEAEMREPLIARTARSGINSLTPFGRHIFDISRQLLDELYELRRVAGAGKPKIKVAISNLLVVNVFPKAYAKFRDEAGCSDVEVVVEDRLDDFEQIVRRLKEGDLDFVITWSLDERKRLIEQESNLNFEEFNHEFDLVLIFGGDHKSFVDKNALPNLPVDLRELAGETVYVLPGDRQPLRDYIPAPNRRMQGERRMCEHYTSVISQIRMGMGGVAIVPAMYRELDHYRKTASLFYARIADIKTPDGKTVKPKIKVAAAYQRGQSDSHALSKPAEALLKAIRNYLSEIPFEPGWWEQGEFTSPNKIVRNIDKYVNAYFLRSGMLGREAPVWRRGELKLVERWKGKGALSIEGNLRIPLSNGTNDYVLTGEFVDGSVFYLKGLQRGGLDSFVATFNTVTADGKSVIGMWSGLDGSLSKPLAGPMILSQENLQTDDQLSKIARIGMLSVLVNVDKKVVENT